MADRAVLLERGQTFYGPTATIPTTYTQSVHLEGRPVVLDDVDPSNTKVRRSQAKVHALIVRNTSGFTLYAGQQVLWASGYRGRRVAGLTYETLQEPAGVVDDHLPSGGVRNGDLFLLIVYGPCLALVSRTAEEANYSADAILYAVTAATSGATTAGRFVAWNTTFSSTETEDGTILKLALNRLGRAISACTTGNTGTSRLIFVERQPH
jgi:hypothetical protein